MMLQPFSLPGCLVQFAVAILATVCFAVAFQTPRRHFWCCGLTGAVGWLVYILCTAAGLSGPVATLVAALLAQGLPAFDAALCGVWLHGAAADLCARRTSQMTMLPHDILQDLGELLGARGL